MHRKSQTSQGFAMPPAPWLLARWVLLPDLFVRFGFWFGSGRVELEQQAFGLRGFLEILKVQKMGFP